jgi:hypothetical protein
MGCNCNRKKHKCTFKDCNNHKMKSKYKNIYLSVCEECFDNLYEKLGINGSTQKETSS